MAKELFPGCVMMDMDELLDIVTGEEEAKPTHEDELREALRWAHQEILKTNRCFKEISEAKDYFDHMNKIHELLTVVPSLEDEAGLMQALTGAEWSAEALEQLHEVGQ